MTNPLDKQLADLTRPFYMLLCVNVGVIGWLAGYFLAPLIAALLASGCGDSHFVYGEAFWNGPRRELTPTELTPTIRYDDDGGVIDRNDAYLRDAGITRVSGVRFHD